jgi:hypothetical protein
MPYNRNSPNQIIEKIDLDDLSAWFEKELQRVSRTERVILTAVADDLESFVRWPAKAMLLCSGWDRKPSPGKKMKYFKYLPRIQKMAKEVVRPFALDGRPNGPAIASFLIAGGERPQRFGSSNSWSIHHLYSGKFPYIDRDKSLHATKEGFHFTQSAGLVAVHPIADAMVDEYPCFTWLLRALAFKRFGYDPDKVLADEHDERGFVAGFACQIVGESMPAGSASAPLGHPEMTMA